MENGGVGVEIVSVLANGGCQIEKRISPEQGKKTTTARVDTLAGFARAII